MSRQSRNVLFWWGELGVPVRVNKSTRGRARADTQGRCDGAGSITDRQEQNPRVISGVLLLVHLDGEALERRPWVNEREDGRAGFARLSFLRLLRQVISS